MEEDSIEVAVTEGYKQEQAAGKEMGESQKNWNDLSRWTGHVVRKRSQAVVIRHAEVSGAYSYRLVDGEKHLIFSQPLQTLQVTNTQHLSGPPSTP